MYIPPLGPDGARQTVNTDLDQDEVLWHFRSGWNVAALNCQDAQYQPIVDGYSAFLKRYAKQLSATNSDMEKRFRRETGSRKGGIKAREEHMTQVYNYFALPAARSQFCQEALAVANDLLLAPPEDVDQFAVAGLTRYEGVFEGFFRDYEKYRVESAAWDAKYGARYGASQPGYVALHGTYEPSVGASLADGAQATLAGTVTDAATGAVIPVSSVSETEVSTPVVQPLPQGD